MIAAPPLSLYRRVRRSARLALEAFRDWSAAPFLRLMRRTQRAQPLMLVFDHRMGGGSNVFRERLIQERVTQGRGSALLVTIGREDRQVECHLHRRRPARHRPADVGALFALLEAAPIDEIAINDLVTWPDPAAVIAAIRVLAARRQVPITVYVHDHFFLCPSWTLLNYLDRYCGLPEPSGCDDCLRQHSDRFVRESGVTAMLPWRQACGDLLAEATDIVCFSEYTAALVRKAFIGRPLAINVRPHKLLHEPLALPRPDPTAPLRIGVLGNIGFHKGARVVNDLVALIAQRGLDAKVIVIGRFSQPPQPGLVVHGPYDRRDLTQLIAEYGINVFLFPSIWPETFSYVCAEIMALKMPLVAFNLGAPAERVRHYPLGALVDEISAEAALEQVIALQRRLTDRELKT